MKLTTADFEYDLPPELIAQRPRDPRDRSRLMVLRREGGEMSHHVFDELPELLRAGDLLVLNDTRVIPARFFCRRRTGGRIEGLFLNEASPDRWQVLLKGAGRCRPGERLRFEGGAGAELVLEVRDAGGQWTVRTDPPTGAAELLGRVGTTPLPPYISRRGDEPADRTSYQTIYANRPGAVAAPTAGLHFTERVMSALDARGIETVTVTLHVGLGTFAPVSADDPADHRMHSEWYELSPSTAERLGAARSAGRRIVAVGTTSVRVLEASAGPDGRFAAGSGWTDIFLYPPAEFRAADALVTNFHLPRSTLLMLVAAFCSPGRTEGVGMVLSAYRQAVRAGYRFYSYGDAMLIV
jgi:S-adenosylmethionine:tRNA ribosyltransferase-isomerase